MTATWADPVATWSDEGFTWDGESLIVLRDLHIVVFRPYLAPHVLRLVIGPPRS